MKSLCLAWPTLMLLALATGCGGEAEGASFENKEQSCQEFCAQSVECGSGIEAADCEEACTDNELISKNGQEIITSCFAENECAADSGSATLVGLCIEDGLDDAYLSETAQKFCAEGLPAFNQCQDQETNQADVALCEEVIALASDEFLGELSECAELPCDRAGSCALLEVLGAVDIDSLGSLTAGTNISGLADAIGLDLGGFGGGDLAFPESGAGMGGASGN